MPGNRGNRTEGFEGPHRFERIVTISNIWQVFMFLVRSSAIVKSIVNISGSVWDHPKPCKTANIKTVVNVADIC